MSYNKEVKNKFYELDPIYNASMVQIDQSTSELRKIAGFHYSYLDATNAEHQEMINRLVGFFMPEAYAQSKAVKNNAKKLDKTGELLNKDNKVKNDRGAGTEILLEFAKLICNTLMVGTLTLLLSQVASHEVTIDNMFQYPLGRSITSGLLMAYSWTIMGLNIWVASNASDRIKTIEGIRAKIDNVNPLYDGCEDYNTPPAQGDYEGMMCYCYKNGKRSRDNSEMCDSVYGEGGIPPATMWGSLANASFSGQKSCLSADGNIGTGKNCCRQKGKKCKRMPGIKGRMGALGASDVYNGYADDMNKDWSGQTDGNDIAGLADRTNNLIKKLKKMEKDKKFGPIIEKSKRGQRKLASDFEKFAAKAFPRGANNLLATEATAAGINSAKDAIAAAKNSVKKSELQFDTKGIAPAGKKSEDGFDFSLDSGSGNSSEALNEAMDADYKYDDISNNAGASIFKILSLRYHRSGLPRLFGDEIPEPEEIVQEKEEKTDLEKSLNETK